LGPGTPYRSSEFHRIVDVDEYPVVDATRVDAPMVRDLYAWWSSANGGRPPSRRLFDVTEHRRLVANLFLVERRGDGFAYRVRGEEVLRLLGGSARGPAVAAHLPRDYRRLLDDYYRRVLEERICFGCRGTLAFWDRSSVLFESLDCPLTDAEGVPRFVLGVIQPTGRAFER
jgi:hypothetical protein